MAKVSLRAYNREIETMTDRGQLDEAIAHCIHIFKTFPKHLETYRLLGKVYLEYKRYRDAVDIFSRVLVAAPDDFVAHVGMSIVRDEENKLDDAIWHMERAFETQPSNAAIQGELQRLYGRRDGVQPPRIRMTRGALAHMYVQGELYPQAISEIKSVLKEDGGRSDMQALLARACYRSGQKNEAAEVASALLRRYPYCLDANRVLVEILGVDRPENAQAYRQRVIELDPYAAQVTGTVFQSNEVSDAAVSLEHLDWNGQPVGVSAQAEWRASSAISMEGGIDHAPQAEPDWLKSSLRDTAPTAPPQPKPASAFETSVPPVAPAPSDAIPDFMRAAGWGQSTGAFDESQPSFVEEESSSAAQPIVQGELPDWVKAMAPPEATQPLAEEEMPDWINQIGPASVTAAAGATSEDTDWMSQLGQPSQPASFEQPSEDQPDWLKQFETPAATSGATEQPDWLKGLGDESQSAPAPAQEEQPDWLRQFDVQSQPSEAAPASSDFAFLDQLTSEPQEPVASAPARSKVDTGSLGTSDQERDDSFAWLESLAAKQGASEGLLTKPEERLEEEPDWIRQAREMSAPSELPTIKFKSLVPQPAGSVDELGKSEKEQDDSFAWLEALAAKQGASEGLLTKPEERLEQEPDWVKQAKDLGVSAPQAPARPVEEPASFDATGAWLRSLDETEKAEPAPAADETAMWLKSLDETEKAPAPPPQPAGTLDELGKTEKEQDDSFAWLEALAAKQGASEGLLTKPEERLEKEPEWVKQAKDLGTTQPPIQTPIQPVEQPASTDDTAAWLRSLDEEEIKPESAIPAGDETAMWLRSLDEAEVTPAPTLPVQDEMPTWMKTIEEEKPVAAEPAVPEKEPDESAWLKSLEEPVAAEPPKVEEEGLPSWLSDLEKETPQAGISAPVSQEELPAWLRDETGEVVAEPTKIEPTRPTDWQPVETKQEEPPAPPPPVVVVEQAPAPEPEPEPKPKPVKKAAPSKTEVKPVTPPEPYKEPVTRRGTGMLTMPIDPILHTARTELSRSNIPGALETYGKLIKKGRFLDEVIFDLREALYRYPVEVSIWQSLGDAYMRANRLQDALDAYTKAEELLR